MEVPVPINVEKEKNQVVISINPKIYPLEVIYSAAYVFLDKFYTIIDGDPETEIIIKLKAKEPASKEDLEKAAFEFHNELVNYSVYVVQAARNKDIRKAIVERALGTNLQTDEDDSSEDEDNGDESEEDVDFIEDPEGIAKPWTPEKAEGLDLPDELKEDIEESKTKESNKKEDKKEGMKNDE